jgi:hypothetical protein
MNNLTTRLVAIHQPNFLPWLGYFGKLLKSDIFVFLDDAQIPKKGSSWSNRVRVLIGGRPQWITSPISREDGYQILKDVSFSEPTWQRTIEETLRMAYSRSSHFEETMPLLQSIFSYETKNLCDWNMNSIFEILSHLSIGLPEIHRSSDFGIQTSSTQRLVELIREVDGTTYLCGSGSSDYLDPNLFAESNLELRYLNFRETQYPQLNTSEFQAGLSIIDVLMMNGRTATADLLSSVRE